MNIETLYETYSRDVFRFALYLSGNWQDAEDITSETFVRAWVAEDSIRMATIKGYLFAIARNLFLKDVCGPNLVIQNWTSPSRIDVRIIPRDGKAGRV
jgi:DNA-directed RNA polymerase specialized sigma24 family protein